MLKEALNTELPFAYRKPAEEFLAQLSKQDKSLPASEGREGARRQAAGQGRRGPVDFRIRGRPLARSRSKYGERAKKGHGKSIRRLAMTSILKRDPRVSRPSVESVRFLSARPQTALESVFRSLPSTGDMLAGNRKKGRARLGLAPTLEVGSTVTSPQTLQCR